MVFYIEHNLYLHVHTCTHNFNLQPIVKSMNWAITVTQLPTILAIIGLGMKVILTTKQLIHSSKCSQLKLNLIVGIFEYFAILSNVEDSFILYHGTNLFE